MPAYRQLDKTLNPVSPKHHHCSLQYCAAKSAMGAIKNTLGQLRSFYSFKDENLPPTVSGRALNPAVQRPSEKSKNLGILTICPYSLTVAGALLV